jgi:CBS domain-containing protein
MSSNPTCCVPEDSALRAAEIMRTEDVGPVPVVLSHNDRRIVGIITDRDLVIRLISEGRAPEATAVSDIMTRNPVTCSENDDVHTAMDAMSRQQVRRIPVVDADSRLCGIIAQADIARHIDEREAGEVLEDVSQSGHNAVGRAFGRAGHAISSSASATPLLIATGLGLAAGAGLMALIDRRR